MGRLIPRAAVLLGLIFASGCAPIPFDDYFRPRYDGAESKLVGNICCGGMGPKEVVEIGGPKQTSYSLAMWRGEEGLEGRAGLYIPAGVTVSFTSDTVSFIDRLTSTRREYKITEAAKKDYNNFALPWRRPYCPNSVRIGGNLLGTPRSPSTGFLWRVDGIGRRGSHVWLNIRLPEEESDSFSLVLPAITVDGDGFQPRPVEFELKKGEWGFVPFNC